MMRGRQVAAVAEFEFLSIVRTKGYLFGTFGMPAMVLVYALFANWLGGFIERQSEGGPQVFGVIDDARLLELQTDVTGSLIDLPDGVRLALEQSGADARTIGPIAFFTETVFRGFDDPERAKAALLAEEIRGFIVLPTDFVSAGAIEMYARDDLRVPRTTARENLSRLLLQGFLEQVPAELGERIRDPIDSHTDWVVDEAGEIRPYDRTALILRVAVPGAFTLALLIAMLTTTGYLVQGVSAEKENRVVEVLLSSTTPDEILSGKLIGLGAAGLLQVVVWFSMVIFGAAVAAGVAVAAGIAVPWKALATGVGFFVGAYFFYGAIMLAFASFGDTQLEGQKLASFWTILAVMPMIFFPVLLQDPHGTAARILSAIPFTAPLTLLARVAIDSDGVPLWEIGLSLVILIVSTWTAIKIGARLFRIGLLAFGSRPKLREIWRQARLSH